jgi:hypothetical protein
LLLFPMILPGGFRPIRLARRRSRLCCALPKAEEGS